MKAILLAAGRGERLRPLTDHTPKCLVPVGGRPLLSIWLELLRDAGVKEVLINLHHLPEKVVDFLMTRSSGLRIRAVFEEQLLGSAGTLLANRGFVEGEDAFYIAYADNLTNMDLRGMLDFHKRRRPPLTMALFRAERPEACGVATLGKDGLVVSFAEKPPRPGTNLANAGIYIAGQDFFSFIPDGGFADMGYHVLPRLAGRMYGYVIDGYLRDIGTITNYRKAVEEWPNLPS